MGTSGHTELGHYRAGAHLHLGKGGGHCSGQLQMGLFAHCTPPNCEVWSGGGMRRRTITNNIHGRQSSYSATLVESPWFLPSFCLYLVPFRVPKMYIFVPVREHIAAIAIVPPLDMI